MTQFRALYTDHAAAVGRLLLRLGIPRSDLEDVVQEVFLVAHRKLATFDTSRPPRPWLCGIATRVASDWRRAAVRREVPDAEPAANVANATAGGRVQEALLAHEAVLQALAPLSFEHRAALLLTEMEGLSAAEVAGLLEIPVGTVYSRLHEARRKFMAALADPTSAAAGGAQAAGGQP